MSHYASSGRVSSGRRVGEHGRLRDTVAHARTAERLAAIDSLTARGASSVVGDLAGLGQVHDLAEEAGALGHVTHAWLATTEDPEARVSGRYRRYRRTDTPRRA